MSAVRFPKTEPEFVYRGLDRRSIAAIQHRADEPAAQTVRLPLLLARPASSESRSPMPGLSP
jgi:hypothetical protein